MTPDLLREIEQFLFHEARLLDEARFDEWLALFAPDGFYWIPASANQTDPIEHVSILYEDHTVLRMRIARLKHPHAYAITPFPRTVHMIGNVTGAPSAAPGADYEVKSTLMVAEYRDGERQLRAALALHRLRRTPEGLRIVLKRVDLTDAASPPGLIHVPL
jgi:benzoate/toluate 1,2-dioxygenase beta subunit